MSAYAHARMSNGKSNRLYSSKTNSYPRIHILIDAPYGRFIVEVEELGFIFE